MSTFCYYYWCLSLALISTLSKLSFPLKDFIKMDFFYFFSVVISRLILRYMKFYMFKSFFVCSVKSCQASPALSLHKIDPTAPTRPLQCARKHGVFRTPRSENRAILFEFTPYRIHQNTCLPCCAVFRSLSTFDLTPATATK